MPDHAKGRRAAGTHRDGPEARLEAEGIKAFAHIIEAAHRHAPGGDEHISTQPTGNALGHDRTIIRGNPKEKRTEDYITGRFG